MKQFALILLFLSISACNTIETPYEKGLYNPNIIVTGDIGNRVKVDVFSYKDSGQIISFPLSAKAENVLFSHLSKYHFKTKININTDSLEVDFLDNLLEGTFEIDCRMTSKVNYQVIKTKVFSKKENTVFSSITTNISPVMQKCLKRHAQDIYHHLQ